MKISGVICEYDPFHNGHKYLLDKIREDGSDCTVVCMSGNFTQRGEPALIDKYTRAKAALLNGADIVIELPVTFACSGAERFAYGGVGILNSTGICDRLYFGSESGNISVLQKAADAIISDKISERLKTYLSSGKSFASSRELAVCDIYGEETAALLREPNNILGIEYIKTIRKLKSNITACTFARKGAAHNSGSITGDIISASKIRELIIKGQDISKYVPENTLSLLSESISNLPDNTRIKKLETAILYKLRTMTAEELAGLPDISEGLENRLYSVIRKACTLEDILSGVKSKRYAMSRLRRIIIHSFLGISKMDMMLAPQYIKILGFNKNGLSAIKKMKKSSSLPLVMKYSDTLQLSPDGKRMYQTEQRCDDIYSLSGDIILPCQSSKMIKINNQ